MDRFCMFDLRFEQYKTRFLVSLSLKVQKQAKIGNCTSFLMLFCLFLNYPACLQTVPSKSSLGGTASSSSCVDADTGPHHMPHTSRQCSSCRVCSIITPFWLWAAACPLLLGTGVYHLGSSKAPFSVNIQGGVLHALSGNWQVVGLWRILAQWSSWMIKEFVTALSTRCCWKTVVDHLLVFWWTVFVLIWFEVPTPPKYLLCSVTNVVLGTDFFWCTITCLLPALQCVPIVHWVDGGAHGHFSSIHPLYENKIPMSDPLDTASWGLSGGECILLGGGNTNFSLLVCPTSSESLLSQELEEDGTGEKVVCRQYDQTPGSL